METSNFRIIKVQGTPILFAQNESALKTGWNLYQASSTNDEVVAGLSRADNNLKYNVTQQVFVYEYTSFETKTLVGDSLAKFINEWDEGYFLVESNETVACIFRIKLLDENIHCEWEQALV